MRTFTFTLAALLLTSFFSLEAASLPMRVRKNVKQQILPLAMCFEKISDIHGIGVSLPCYKIRVGNGRKGAGYHLVSLDLSGAYKDEGEFIINEQGELQRHGDEGAYIAVLQGFQPGEKVKYYVVAKDKKQQAEIELIPWPIEKKNVFGQTMRLQLASPQYSTFLLIADGYNPAEPLRVKTYVDGKMIETQGNASREGTFVSLLMPAAHTKAEGGEVTFAIEGLHSCNSVTIPWGVDFRKKGEEFIKKKNLEYVELKSKLKELSFIEETPEKERNNDLVRKVAA